MEINLVSNRQTLSRLSTIPWEENVVMLIYKLNFAYSVVDITA